MMNTPPLNELIDKVGSRYTLVTAVAKCARQLMQNPEELGDRKPVSVAVEQIWAGKLRIVLPSDNNK